MFPYFILFGKQISLYFIMSMVGLFAAGILAVREYRRNKQDENELIIISLISAIGLFFGGHILYGITKINTLYRLIIHFDKLKSFKEFIDVFKYIFGGQVFYGGLIGLLITGYIYTKKKHIDSKLYFDILAFSIPLFHCFARIGCFLSGCCYGVESKIGFTYTHAYIESANHINRFPIQLIEASYNLLLFFLLYYLYRKNKMRHKLLGLYLLLYPIGRFIFEFFRGDEYRGFLFGLSTSQIISIILFIFSLYLIFVKKAEEKKV